MIAALVLSLCCPDQVFGQNSDNSTKKITITKRKTDSDGTEITEIIVKKGKAAENFDSDKYIKENKSDNVQLDIRTEDTNDDDNYSIARSSNNSYPNCDNTQTFLGVEEDSDEDANEKGLVVQVVRGSGAEKSGLRHNDMILKLNDVETNRWSDLSKFVNRSKPGDAVKIEYQRNGKTMNTTATLTKRSEVKCDTKTKKSFLGVSDEDDNDENLGVAVSITNGSAAEKAGLEDGDVIVRLEDTPISDFEDISDFMAYANVDDKVKVTFERDGKQKVVEATLGEEKYSNNGNWNNFNWDNGTNFNWNNGNNVWNGNNNCNITANEKEACLGVYTSGTTMSNDDSGARITDFTTESAARDESMKVGDVIVSVNGSKVENHDELWTEIAKYKAGDKVKVAYMRADGLQNVEATLKACRNNTSRVQILDDAKPREFYVWNWGGNEAKSMKERQVITIHKAGEGGDVPKVNTVPDSTLLPQSRQLKLVNFRAFPNPSQGQVTVEFKGQETSTVVALYDLGGRQLFREELNAFGGSYAQQFDLREYAKGTIVIQVQQGDKMYTEQLLVN